MKRLISHADAMRSTCGRGRVTHRRPRSLREIEGGRLLAAVGFRTSGAHGDGLLETLDLGAAGGVEEVDVANALVVLGEPGQLPVDARARGGGLPLESLEHLAVARGELPVVRVARLVEQANDVRPAHVLDLLDADQGRLAPLALDLLGKPLEVLVTVRRVRQQVGRALERDGAQRAQPAPHAHAQARRGRRQTYYQQEELGIHCCGSCNNCFIRLSSPVLEPSRGLICRGAH